MITVYWNNPEENIIRLDYADPLTAWDEYNNAVKQWHEMIRSKSSVVHTIHNPGSAKMPGGNAFMHVRRAMNNTPHNSGLIVIVVSDFFARSVIDILLRMTVNANLRMVNSLEEAETLIKNSLPSAPTSAKRSTSTGIFSRESLGL